MQLHGQDNPDELLSAAFDGEFDGVLNVSTDRRSKLDSEWAAVRAEIQSIPVDDVDLVKAVRAECLRAPRTAPARRRPFCSRRNAWLTAIPGLTTVAIVLIFAVLPMLREGGLENGPSNSQLLAEALVWLNDHPDPKSYQFVVVEIAENASVEEAVREVLGAAEERGAEFTAPRSTADQGAVYLAGFLLTAGRETQVVMDSLADRQENLEWNPVDIDGRSHDEIKKMFLASMKMPTKSDRLFGAMYVVDEVSRELLQKELPAQAPDATRSIAHVDSEDATSPRAERELDLKRVTPTPDVPGAEPLIVIFRKRHAIPAAPPAAEQGMLPRPALSQSAV